MRASNFPALSRLLPWLVSLLAFIIGSVALLPTTGLAQGSENTVVVVNADSSDSLAIANRYVPTSLQNRKQDCHGVEH